MLIDFTGDVEIPANVRHEWSSLRKDGIHSVWSPFSQKHSQEGQAGVGVVSLRGALVSLPSTATSQLRALFHQVELVGPFCHWEVGGVCIL